MHKNPTVSVIMACYNADKTLARAIDSILNQTEETIEFIIVDDASKDQTASILKRYQQADNRIQVLTNEQNRGISYSLNRAIRQAKAPFIARMDADDSSMPNRLACQLTAMQQQPELDVLGTGAQLADTVGNVIGSVVLPLDHAQIMKQRYMRPLFIHPSVMFRQRFFEKCGYYDEGLRRAEDLDLWLRAQHQAIYGNLPDLLHIYSYRPKILFRTFCSDLIVRFRHMRRNGELMSKGYELIWYSIRFLLLYYTAYIPRTLRKST